MALRARRCPGPQPPMDDASRRHSSRHRNNAPGNGHLLRHKRSHAFAAERFFRHCLLDRLLLQRAGCGAMAPAAGHNPFAPILFSAMTDTIRTTRFAGPPLWLHAILYTVLFNAGLFPVTAMAG